MHQVIKTVLVEHTAQQMYDLVEQIEQYHEFLPWCGGASVTRPPDGPTLEPFVVANPTRLTADNVAFATFSRTPPAGAQAAGCAARTRR